MSYHFGRLEISIGLLPRFSFATPKELMLLYRVLVAQGQ